MRCTEMLEQIVAYLDGESPADATREMDDHLGACAACRGEADLLRATSALVRNQPPLEPSATWDLALENKLSRLKLSRLAGEMAQLRRATQEIGARLQRMEEEQAAD